MSATASGARVFRVVSERPSPRFLGVSAAVRNERVARRYAKTSTAEDAPTLTIPAGVIITPALVPALPPASGTWRLIWHLARPPIIWNGTSGSPAEAPATLQLPDGAALDVSTAEARRQSAWRLLRASGKPTDGWLSRHVHRKISRACSYALLQLGLTANHATSLTFFVGVAAAWLMAETSHATMIAGALLFWFASIADGFDGVMARLTLSESARGEQLDTAVDHATHLLGLAGVMAGWWRQGISAAGWTLAISVAIGLPLVLLWTMHLVRRARGITDQWFVDTKPIELGVTAAARTTGAPLLRLASAVFVLFRREAIALGFVLVSLATGRRAAYPALLAAGLVVVAATLLVYRRELETAMRAR